jgi:dimethylglycine dehydrogenase
MTGMDRWFDWSKDFIGAESARKEHEEDGAQMKLVTMEIDPVGADGSDYEPVWVDGRRVGYVTSGGYGHVVGKSLAMGLVERDHSHVGTELTTHVVGVERPAQVIDPSPYDPSGSSMRA